MSIHPLIQPANMSPIPASNLGLPHRMGVGGRSLHQRQQAKELSYSTARVHPPVSRWTALPVRAASASFPQPAASHPHPTPLKTNKQTNKRFIRRLGVQLSHAATKTPTPNVPRHDSMTAQQRARSAQAQFATHMSASDF